MICIFDMKRLDLTGQKFGRLIVTSSAGSNGRPLWNCRCDCGNTRVVMAGNLRGGISTSCGCFTIERIKEVNTTHGMSGTKEWMIWCQMRQRCLNPNHSRYAEWGGRGITVCDRWLKFENFIADMGLRPPDKTSIDRIDNDGNYEPNNCRWATAKEQRLNQRKISKKYTKVGYWYSAREPTLPVPESGDEFHLDIIEYLKNGKPLHQWRGWATCRICSDHVGSKCLTDGTYQWPEGLFHYVEKHGTPLPQSFIEYIRSS